MTRTIKYFTVLAIIFCFAITGNAREEKLNFDVDVATFVAAEGQSYMEIYYKIPFSQLTFRPVTEADDEILQESFSQVSSFDVEIGIADEQGSQIAADHKIDIAGAQNRAEIFDPTKSALRQRSLVITPGKFKLTMKVTDSQSGKSGLKIVDLNVPSYGTNALSISDVELATFIKPSDTKSPFYKNGYEIYPNPSGVFGNVFPNLYFYYEVYNLSEGAPQTFTKRYEILNAAGNVVKDAREYTGDKTGDISGQIWRISVNDLSDGDYTLRIKITDDATGESAIKEQEFTIKADQGEMLTVSEEELDKLFRGIKYIADDEERDVIDDLASASEKQEFILSFWDKRGKGAMHEYYQNLQLVNQKFGTLNKEGWRSDRGRVLLSYGKPDNIESHTMEFGAREYEIWRYYEDKYYFIFASPMNSYEELQLVDSNVPGEVSNPEWLHHGDDEILGGKNNLNRSAVNQAGCRSCNCGSR
jgi:GWxTD domain-containing protein